MKLKAEFSCGSKQSKNYIFYQIYQFGRDWIVMIGGGESHFGSLAYTDSSLKKNYYQYTPGIHKETEIVEQVVQKLQPLIKNELIVICGIHYDQIDKQQILEIIQHNKHLLEQAKEFFRNRLV